MIFKCKILKSRKKDTKKIQKDVKNQKDVKTKIGIQERLFLKSHLTRLLNRSIFKRIHTQKIPSKE